MRDPNFMIPNRCPRATVMPGPEAADHPAREHADDLPENNRLPRVLDTDFAALVLYARAAVVGGQEPPGTVRHIDHPTTDRRTVDVHVERRQEDADLLPAPFRRRARVGGPGVQDPAVGRRQHGIERDVGRLPPIGIAKEEREYRGQPTRGPRRASR